MSNNTHNALVTLDPDFNIVPDLAKSWEIIDKGKEYGHPTQFSISVYNPLTLLELKMGH